MQKSTPTFLPSSPLALSQSVLFPLYPFAPPHMCLPAMQVELQRSMRLARYAGRADLAERFAACGGFRLAMGFGLHVGWAIEGAIGSEFK
eukprot:158741-Chlamydomonas_euryale.AAC.2